jgi:CBS-domain-containing membrane protein
VLDDEERVIGVITSSDLLRAAEEERDTAMASSEYLRDLVEFSGPDWGRGLTDFQDRLTQLCVADVMTAAAVTVRRDTPIAQVARTLREHAIHRAWVEEDGRLCGVISTFDLLPLVEQTA